MGNAVGAVVSTVGRGVVFLFLKIKEPRVERLIHFVIYLSLLVLGHSILADPPGSFVGILGALLVQAFGWFLAIGSTATAIAVLPGVWWLERLGIICLWVGIAIYVAIALAIGNSLGGVCIGVALGLALLVRWRHVNQFQLAPGR